MTDFIMLLNAQLGKGKYDIQNAMDDEVCHMFQESPAGGLIATADNPLELEMESSQHISLNRITVFAMGHLNNSDEIFKHLGKKNETNHPYEAIIWLYLRYGINYTLQLIDGYVSFILVDYVDLTKHPKIYVVRDPLGYVPLWIMAKDKSLAITGNEVPIFENLIAISTNEMYLKRILKERSDGKELMYTSMLNTEVIKFGIQLFEPGSYVCFTHSELVLTDWKQTKSPIKYYTLPRPVNNLILSKNLNFNEKSNYVLKILKNYISQVLICTEGYPSSLYFRLDGDLSSVFLLAIAKSLGVKNCRTFSCGPPNATWFASSRNIANAFSTKHMEIMISKEYLSENFSSFLHKKAHIEYMTSYIAAKHLVEHSRAKHVVLPIGAHIWQIGKDKDTWEDDMMIRKSLQQFISEKASVYMKEFWHHQLKTHTPYIQREIAELWLTLCKKKLEKRADIWNKVGISEFLDLDICTDQTAEWEYLKHQKNSNLSSATIIHWEDKQGSLFC